jgi:hypothetical protein
MIFRNGPASEMLRTVQSIPPARSNAMVPAFNVRESFVFFLPFWNDLCSIGPRHAPWMVGQQELRRLKNQPRLFSSVNNFSFGKPALLRMKKERSDG